MTTHPPPHAAPRLPGRVWLIGAGPGAADLITVRGARLLAEADVVLHDALVTDDMLALCPQALMIGVGKRCGQLSTAQAFINKQLVDSARKYPRVVRLKGGDPMLFGRADEELRALEAAGIAVEIVPGVTAALAAAAASGQPLTRRGVARSVAFFTSSTDANEPDATLLPSADTLVQYMGGREAVNTARRLLEAGRAADTPVVVVENCSRADQQIMRLTLLDMERGLGTCTGPVLVMIGTALESRSEGLMSDASVAKDCRAGVVEQHTKRA
ncbi:MAG: uroporphyrinogen-III C-methyltransferase [Burkholderiaceae bacterium]